MADKSFIEQPWSEAWRFLWGRYRKPFRIVRGRGAWFLGAQWYTYEFHLAIIPGFLIVFDWWRIRESWTRAVLTRYWNWKIARRLKRKAQV